GLVPGAAAVRRGRLEGGIPRGPAPFAPDVALELISPHDTWVAIQWMCTLSLHDALPIVWVNPQERTVEVSSPTHGTRTFAEGETVVIEALPGFGKDLFPPPAAQPSEGSR